MAGQTISILTATTKLKVFLKFRTKSDFKCCVWTFGNNIVYTLPELNK